MHRITSRTTVLALSVLLLLWAVPALGGGTWDKPWQSSGSLTQILVFGPDAARCNPGDPLVVIQGGGRTSYLGVVNIDQSHCQNLSTGQFYDGEYTLTGADGSTVFGSYGGQSVPTVNCPDIGAGQCVFRALGVYTIDGGTGSQAMILGGGGDARGTLNTMTGMAMIYLQGNVVSDGALKGPF